MLLLKVWPQKWHGPLFSRSVGKDKSQGHPKMQGSLKYVVSLGAQEEEIVLVDSWPA